MKNLFLPGFLVVLVAGPLPSVAEVLGPYTSDADTIGLYHFDESSGAADPGNPIANFGTGGAGMNGTNTGGPDGRNNAGGGGYGAAAAGGFGSSFDVLASGDDTYHSGITGSTTGGGVLTSGNLLQSALQGADGAFTLEALINLRALTLGREYTIISHDGSTTRGFAFRINTSRELSFYNGSGNITIDLPSSGTHQFVANSWYHVAFVYNGNAGAANNASFYWTALSSSATQANLLGTNTLAADLSGTSNNLLGFGTTTRSFYRFELDGYIDEVRISGIARDANDFLFATIPEPSSSLLISLAAIVWFGGRRAGNSSLLPQRLQSFRKDFETKISGKFSEKE